MWPTILGAPGPTSVRLVARWPGSPRPQQSSCTRNWQRKIQFFVSQSRPTRMTDSRRHWRYELPPTAGARPQCLALPQLPTCKPAVCVKLASRVAARMTIVKTLLPGMSTYDIPYSNSDSHCWPRETGARACGLASEPHAPSILPSFRASIRSTTQHEGPERHMTDSQV